MPEKEEKVFNRRRSKNTKAETKPVTEPVSETEPIRIVEPEVQPQAIETPQPPPEVVAPKTEKVKTDKAKVAKKEIVVPPITEVEPEFITAAEQPYSPFIEEPKMRGGDTIPDVTEIGNEPKIKEPDLTESETRDINEPSPIDDDSELFPPKREPKKPLIDNPDAEDLTPAEKKEAAAMAANGLIDVYGYVTQKGFKWWATPSKKKLRKSIMDKELNPDIQVTMQDGTFKFSEIMENLDGQTDELFGVSAETREKILPPLTKVCMDNGLTPTPMQQVLFYVGEDLVQKVQIASEIKSQVNQIIEYAKDMTKQLAINMAEVNRENETLRANNTATENENQRLRRELDEARKAKQEANRNEPVSEAEIISEEKTVKPLDEGDTKVE